MTVHLRLVRICQYCGDGYELMQIAGGHDGYCSARCMVAADIVRKARGGVAAEGTAPPRLLSISVAAGAAGGVGRSA